MRQLCTPSRGAGRGGDRGEQGPGGGPGHAESPPTDAWLWTQEADCEGGSTVAPEVQGVVMRTA